MDTLHTSKIEIVSELSGQSQRRSMCKMTPPVCPIEIDAIAVIDDRGDLLGDEQKTTNAWRRVSLLIALFNLK